MPCVKKVWSPRFVLVHVFFVCAMSLRLCASIGGDDRVDALFGLCSLLFSSLFVAFGSVQWKL